MNVLTFLRWVPAALLFAEAEAAAAHAVPTWTDKEVMIAVGSTVAALLPVCLFIIRLAGAGYRRTARLAKHDQDVLRERVKELEQQDGSQPPHPDLVKLKADLSEAQGHANQLLDELNATKNLATSERQLAEKLQGELDAARSDLKQYEADLGAEQRRIHRALQKGGQTWSEKVLAGVPKFSPLDPEGRRTAIVSVLNLKGGVGKTTITGNLGTALDALGYRALLLDLDLQGSLTGLFLSEAEQERQYNAQRLLGDFLASSFGAEFPNLLDYTQPILSSQESALVPTTDTLAYAETNLTIRWLLREGNRDPRFLLRRELQLKRVTNRFDVVLLDCPPLINVCCVNALAASDYLLIPILPSKQATARVPVLLKRLKEFRENINPSLKVMGVLANRTHRSELTTDEVNRLSGLRHECRDVWGEDVPQFETFIRQSIEVRAAEDSHRPLRPEEETYRAFLDLAHEFVGRLPTFCRPSNSARAPVQEALP